MFAEAYDKLRATGYAWDVWIGAPESASINPRVLRQPTKAAILRPMHFSRLISQSHSTFSLLAALLLRGAR